MHEVTLAGQIVHMVTKEAQRQKASEVIQVTITIGSLMQIEHDSLQFSLDVLKGEYPSTARAHFVLVDEPARVHCPRCDAETTVMPWSFVCAACGSTEVVITAGDDLVVTEMEVNEDERIENIDRATGASG